MNAMGNGHNVTERVCPAEDILPMVVIGIFLVLGVLGGVGINNNY